MHLFDVAEIEVLKGPQGSLYGRDAEAGAVIINTVQPTNDFHAFIDGSFSRGSTFDSSAAISGPIVPDKVLFRLAGSYFHTKGVIPNSFRHVPNDSVPHDWSVRGSLLFNFGPNSRLTLIAQHGDYNAGHVFFVPVWSGNPNDFQLPRSNFPNYGNGSSTNLSGKFESDLGFATLTAIGGYTPLKQLQITDVDFTNPVEATMHPNALPYQHGDNQPFSNTIYSEEVRLTGPTSSRLRWLISEDFPHAKQFINTHLFFDLGNPTSDPFNPALTLTQNPAVNSRSNWGASAQVDYDATTALTLTAGIRYDTDKRRQLNLLNNVTRTATFDSAQPRLSAAYKFSPDKLVYASWGIGFRSGGFNPPSFRIPIYADERLDNFEVGFKTQWLDHHLTLNGALFHSLVNNLQFSAIDFSTGSEVTSNVDRARINGAELEAVVTPVSGFDLFARMGLSDPKITKFAANPTVVGNVLPRGYKASFNTGFDFNQRDAPDTNFFIRGDLQHYSSKYWFVDNLDVQSPKTYVNGSFGVSYRNFTATVWGKNIFGVRSYETYFPRAERADVGVAGGIIPEGIWVLDAARSRMLVPAASIILWIVRDDGEQLVWVVVETSEAGEISIKNFDGRYGGEPAVVHGSGFVVSLSSPAPRTVRVDGEIPDMGPFHEIDSISEDGTQMRVNGEVQTADGAKSWYEEFNWLGPVGGDRS